MPARTPIDKALNSRVSFPNSYIRIITNTDSRTPSLVTIPADAALNPVTDCPQPSPESSQQQPCGPYGAVICSPHSQIPPEVCSPHSSLVFLAHARANHPHVSVRAHHPTTLVHPHFSIPRHLQVLTTADPDDWTEQELRHWLNNVGLSRPFPTSDLKPN